MAKQAGYGKQIWVYAGWAELGGTTLMGTLTADQVRGRGVFLFPIQRNGRRKGRHWYWILTSGCIADHSIAGMINPTSDYFSIPHPIAGAGS
jgi:hypothetical protein